MYFEVRVALFHSEGRRDSSDRVEDGVVANAGGRCLTKGGALRGRLGEVECLRVLQGQNDGRTLTGAWFFRTSERGFNRLSLPQPQGHTQLNPV